SALRLHRFALVRSRHVPRLRRLWRGRARREARDHVVRDRAARRHAVGGAGRGAPRAFLPSLPRHLFPHPDPPLPHTALLLLLDRRCMRRALSAHPRPRPRIEPIQQDRVPGRSFLLLQSRAPHHRRRHDVAHRAFTLRPASQSRTRQCPQGRISRRSRAPRSPRCLCHFGGIRRSRRSDPRLSRGTGRPRAGLLDAIGPARAHDGARRFSQLLRPDHRRVRVPPAAGSAAIADPVLALHSRRRSRRYRHRLSRGTCRARRQSAPDSRGENRMTALLETKSISNYYGALRAVEESSIAIRPEELVSVVGPNGAGKTTLVNLLTGLLTPTTGEVLFMGENIAGIGPVRLAERGLVRSFQLIQIFPQLTVAETIAAAVVSRQKKRWRLFASLATDQAIAARVAEVADIFGLAQRLGTPAATLSQGEKKLLDVASAFALDPRIILLEEPPPGVSTAEKHGIMRTLIAAAKRAGVQSILLVEHDMDLVAAYSQRIIALSQGRVLADLPPERFFADPQLIEKVIGKRRRH